ncbi:complement factor B-like [Odontesthes bonariensis]
MGGHYTLTKKLVQGSKLIYHCPEGYYPHPHVYRACQPGGLWDPEPATHQKCQRVQCPDPTVIKNGFVTPQLEKYFVSNVTTYECHAGYAMRGPSSRTCLPNGKWSGYTTICSHDYNFTHDTAHEVSEAFGRAIMDTLVESQPPDDIYSGRLIRISKNGTLNIYIAMDISPSTTEEAVDRVRQAVVALIKKISSFIVSPNYEIIFFSSEIHEVVNIVDFFDGKAKLNSMIDDLERFQTDGHTGTNLNLAFKTFEERMALIKQLVGEESFKDHRHVIILFTDGAYNMGGIPEPTVNRIKNMVYMNQADGSRDEFLDIYVFGIGAVIYDDDLQPLTAGTGGQHYFRLKHDTNLHETFDEMIDESEVVGLCGLHKNYETTYDRVSKQKRYPWMAFVIVQGDSPKKCLGSLVSPKFVLTAAHCFQFGDLPKDVTVEIEDRPGSRVKKVKTFTLHPNYNVKARVDQGVAEFYDFDVALIQLEEAVQISSYTRPICIPCTQETSHALKLVGASTCPQQEELLLKTDRERLSFLTRAAPLVQEKDVFAKLGDSRDACINKALTARGVTARDPKVAVTNNFLCTGGHRDHIACAGDAGGAVFKDYEQRTIQIGLVSWGTKELCTSGGMVESTDDSRDFHINLFRMVPFLKSILGNDDQDDYAPLTFLPG